jgi:hypothetical protein
MQGDQEDLHKTIEEAQREAAEEARERLRKSKELSAWQANEEGPPTA